MRKFIKRGLIFMSFLPVIMSLFGCGKAPAKPEGELNSISISQNHMDRTYCYSFWVRKEKDTYLLDANCILADYDNDKYSEVNFTDKEISKKEFESFTQLDEKYDFLSLIKPEKAKKSIFFALDETVSYFTVKYGDDTFSLYTNGDCYSEVCSCFFALAEKYNN
ncbi:MAG: hypothetical protein ACI4RM_06920 [Ruminococcus sp.]